MDENADEIDGRTEARTREVANTGEKDSSRRQLLRQIARVSLGLPLFHCRARPLWAQVPPQPSPDSQRGAPIPHPQPTSLLPEDDQFLDDLERGNFLFFWEQANPETGLIKDRCNVRVADTSVAASIASTGLA
jgi:hypothetical protein